MQRKAAMEYQFRLGKGEGLRPRPRDKCIFRKRMWTLARKAGRLIADPHLSFCSFKSQPRLIPSSVAHHMLQPPLSLVEHSSPYPLSPCSLLCPRPQLQQALLGTPQAGPAWEAYRLTTNIHLSLSSSKTNPPDLSPALYKTTLAASLPGPAPFSSGSHRSTPSNSFLPIHYFMSAPNSNRDFLGACRPLEA